MTLGYDWLMNNNLWERNLLQVISLPNSRGIWSGFAELPIYLLYMGLVKCAHFQ
jgi:hypothetical protein